MCYTLHTMRYRLDMMSDMENGYGKPRNPNLKALKPMETTEVVRVRGRLLDVEWFASLDAAQRGALVHAVTSSDLKAIQRFALQFNEDAIKTPFKSVKIRE